MRRLPTAETKVARRVDEPGAEVVVPEPVDDHAGRERVYWRRDPLREPAAALALGGGVVAERRRLLRIQAQGSRHDLVGLVLRVAATLHAHGLRQLRVGEGVDDRQLGEIAEFLLEPPALRLQVLEPGDLGRRQGRVRHGPQSGVAEEELVHADAVTAVGGHEREEPHRLWDLHHNAQSLVLTQTGTEQLPLCVEVEAEVGLRARVGLGRSKAQRGRQPQGTQRVNLANLGKIERDAAVGVQPEHGVTVSGEVDAVGLRQWLMAHLAVPDPVPRLAAGRRQVGDHDILGDLHLGRLWFGRDRIRLGRLAAGFVALRHEHALDKRRRLRFSSRDHRQQHVWLLGLEEVQSGLPGLPLQHLDA